MLYVQFVQNQQVDFASKEVNVVDHDLREETMTFTREELALMVEGAGLELSRVKESLEAKLVEKEQEAVRLSQAQTPPPNNSKVEAQLNRLSQDVQGISHRLNPLRQGNHISHFLVHPDLVTDVNNVALQIISVQCAINLLMDGVATICCHVVTIVILFAWCAKCKMHLRARYAV